MPVAHPAPSWPRSPRIGTSSESPSAPRRGDRLDRARDLLPHVLPSGDPAAIVDRALTVVLDVVVSTEGGVVETEIKESVRLLDEALWLP
jgi:hypothetical protein